MMTCALLSTTYFGPIQWYQKLNRYDSVVIDTAESYRKQTYRNRCIIATTNGPQALTVPVEHQPQPQNLKSEISNLKSVRLSDHGNWRHLHWQAIQSAYGESPFFEYYEDDLRPFFVERRWTFLVDFNEAIRAKICELIDIHPHVTLDAAFNLQSSIFNFQSSSDFRDAINPKHPAPDPDFLPRRYYQVYEHKHGFQPNLSILDLLLNMGPESIFYV